MNPLISIIVNVYNSRMFLEQCLDSILSSSYKNIEIILVDDGSTDGSDKICEKYQEIHNNVKMVRSSSNNGLVKSRKLGLIVSNGEYISFVDADDWVDKDLYKLLLEDALTYMADIVIGGHKEYFEGIEYNILNNIKSGCYIDGINKKDILNIMLYTGSFSDFGVFTYTWGKLFKRDLLLAIQLNVDDKISIGEDASVLYPAILKAKRIRINNFCGYYYRQRLGSMVKTVANEIDEYRKINILYKYLRKIFDSYYEIDLNIQLKYYILSQLLVRTKCFSNNVCFPFNNIIRGKKVILYGFGTYGQHFYNRINNSNFLQEIKISDDNWQNNENLGINIENIDSLIKQYNYDYILITYVNEKYSNSIKKFLINRKVEESKILQIPYNSIDFNLIDKLERINFENLIRVGDGENERNNFGRRVWNEAVSYNKGCIKTNSTDI